MDLSSSTTHSRSLTDFWGPTFSQLPGFTLSFWGDWTKQKAPTDWQWGLVVRRSNSSQLDIAGLSRKLLRHPVTSTLRNPMVAKPIASQIGCGLWITFKITSLVSGPLVKGPLKFNSYPVLRVGKGFFEGNDEKYNTRPETNSPKFFLERGFTILHNRVFQSPCSRR